VSLKSKAKAERKREQLKLQRALEEQKLQDSVDRLKTMTSGFARTKRTDRQQAIFEASKMPQYARQREVTRSADLSDRFTGKGRAIPTKHNDPIMQARDEAAHERTKEIMKRVDIGYNKGGLMLLSESEFAAMKKGELKRRS
jgi:hypothetical protein